MPWRLQSELSRERCSEADRDERRRDRTLLVWAQKERRFGRAWVKRGGRSKEGEMCSLPGIYGM